MIRVRAVSLHPVANLEDDAFGIIVNDYAAVKGARPVNDIYLIALAVAQHLDAMVRLLPVEGQRTCGYVFAKEEFHNCKNSKKTLQFPAAFYNTNQKD